MESIEAFLIQCAIRTFCETHHPLSFSVVDGDDHHATGFELFNQFFRDIGCTGCDEYTIEWPVCGQPLKTITKKQTQRRVVPEERKIAVVFK